MKASKDFGGLIINGKPAVKQYLELKNQGISSEEAYAKIIAAKTQEDKARADRIQASRQFNKEERDLAIEARARVQSELEARIRAEKSQAELAAATASDRDAFAKEKAQMNSDIDSLKRNVNENAGKMSREEAARVKAELMKRKTEYDQVVKEGEQSYQSIPPNEVWNVTLKLNYFKNAANTMGELISHLDKAEVPKAVFGNEAWSRALDEEQAKAPNDPKLVLIDRVNRRLGIQGGKKRTMRKQK
jgi:hypothetical protein